MRQSWLWTSPIGLFTWLPSNSLFLIFQSYSFQYHDQNSQHICDVQSSNISVPQIYFSLHSYWKTEPHFLQALPTGSIYFHPHPLGPNQVGQHVAAIHFGQGCICLAGLPLKLAWDFSFLVNIFKWLNKPELSKTHHFKKTDAVGVCTTSSCGFLLFSESIPVWSWMYHFQCITDCCGSWLRE